MRIKDKIIKEYYQTPVDALAEKPVYALSGISDRNALMLYKVFRIETIHDLGNLEFARTAVAICNAADSGYLSFEKEFAEISIKKKFRKLSPAMVAEGPVHMLLGISAGKGKLLKRSLGINTIRDLAEMKFIKVVRNIDYKEKLIKNYQDIPLDEIPEAPLYALQGVSVRDAGLLKKAFGIETIKDLSSLKYFHWGKEILDAAENGRDINREIFKNRLKKKYETLEISRLIKAPVFAMQGISDKDGDLIYRAFKIKTIGKFAELKYWKWANGIMELYTSAASETEEPARRNIAGVRLKVTVFFLVILFLLVLIYLISSGRITEIIKKYYSPGVEKETVQSLQEVKPDMGAKDKSYSGVNRKELSEGYYNVQSGDSLVSISKKIYGTHEKWPEIYMLNKNTIANPELLYPGQKLYLNQKDAGGR